MDWIPSALLGMVLVLFTPGAAPAGDRPEFDDRVCRPPISTCGPVVNGDALGWQICPPGSTCVCVPSCPACRDCAVRVCVVDPSHECRTACDCAPGLGCFNGQCLAGFAPVFCCDARLCPAGEICQHRDGEHDRCSAPDPMCMERIRKVNHKIERLIHRASRCRADQDCVHIETTTQCGGTCGAFINGKYEEKVGRRIRRFDHKICDGFVEDGCPFATPGCQAVRGVCVEGRCAGVAVLPGPRPRPILLDFEQAGGRKLDLQASP